MCKLLLAYKCPVDKANIDGHTPMHVAAMGNQPEVIRLLSEYGSDVNRSCSAGTPIAFAAFNGHLDAVKALV